MIFRLTDKYDLVNSVCPILEDSVIQYVSKALVSIEVYISISINKPNFNYYAKGNGFIANREKGLIITNKHIVNTENIQKIWVKFCTSDVVKAKIIYSDPEHDFTIISASIPDNVSELELESFVKSNIINSSLVYSLNNENIFYTGKIIGYESKGIYFSQSIVIDFDTKPGDSGAPLLNSANKVIGILFASSSMNAVALISDYIIDALTYLTNARLPERKSAGILFDYCKFEDMIKIDQVKKGVLCNHEYVICVRKKISVPEIENKFQLLDVVDLVNGKKISDIYLLQKIINEIEDIQINIWRNGKVFSIMPERFNLFSYQIKSYFYIDEAVIYPPGIFTHLITGAPLDKLFYYL
jgi:S1-C subfamily serine protease